MPSMNKRQHSADDYPGMTVQDVRRVLRRMEQTGNNAIQAPPGTQLRGKAVRDAAMGFYVPSKRAPRKNRPAYASRRRPRNAGEPSQAAGGSSAGTSGANAAEPEEVEEGECVDDAMVSMR